MPLSFHFQPERHRVEIRGEGADDFAGARASAQALIAHPDYAPTLAVMVDVTAYGYVASFPEALRFRDFFAQNRASFQGPMAIVTRAGAPFGAARIVASLADLLGMRIAVFDNRGDAERWLAGPDGGGAGPPGAGPPGEPAS